MTNEQKTKIIELRKQGLGYEFLTPSNKLIRKTIVPFLFEVKKEGNPIPKEERMISIKWMEKEEFIEKCTHENVKDIVKEI